VIYISGGHDKGLMSLSNVLFQYDLKTGVSTLLNTTLQLSRDGHCSIFYKGKLIICGGFTNGNTTTCVEYYDPITHKVGLLPSLVRARYSFTPIIYQNDLYAVGGDDAETIEMFNFDNNCWKIVASIRNKRAHSAACLYHHRLYFFGGSSAYFTEDSTWDYLDMQTRQWCSDNPHIRRDMPIAQYSNGYAVMIDS
jgi:N-acetylneuraminic acid mutarotase